MVATIVIKFFIWMWCSRFRSSGILALAQVCKPLRVLYSLRVISGVYKDAKNDVFFNVFSLLLPVSQLELIYLLLRQINCLSGWEKYFLSGNWTLSAALCSVFTVRSAVSYALVSPCVDLIFSYYRVASHSARNFRQTLRTHSQQRSSFPYSLSHIVLSPSEGDLIPRSLSCGR